MAGIGFELRKLFRGASMMPRISVTLKSMLITSGPWITAMITLFSLNFFVAPLMNPAEFTTLQSLIVYSFVFSLLLTSPISNMITRYTSDYLYMERLERLFPVLCAGILTLFIPAMSLSLWFLFRTPSLKPAGFSAPYLFISLCVLWLVMVFVSILKEHNLVSLAFVLGMGSSVAAMTFLSNGNLKFCIDSMSFGVNLTTFTLITLSILEFGLETTPDFGFFRSKNIWLLGLSGFFYQLLLWIDKLIYWFFSIHSTNINGFLFFPAYDFAVFLANLAIIPGFAYFTVFVETDFFESQRQYLQVIESGQNLSEIRMKSSEIVISYYRGILAMILFQTVLGGILILILSFIFDSESATILSIPILRITTLGVCCQVILQTILIFLYYFDLQVEVLLITFTGCVVTGILSFFMRDLPLEWVGYSAFFGFLFTLILAAFIGHLKISTIRFTTFMSNELN